jgi:tRNA threonylcarbamoyladenosine biosynthesis protein TsaB
VILAFDTATPSTAVAVLAPDGPAVERRDDPAPGERPRHAERLLPLAEAALAGAGATWEDVRRLAVGVGPGGFTGLRLGIATARALAQGRGLPVVGVSSLEALAAGADAVLGGASASGAGAETVLGGAAASAAAAGPATIAAVIDARRGEVFAAAWRDALPVLEPAALAPEALAARLPASSVAVGDGAVRFREQLERAGVAVPADGSPAHRLSALAVARLAQGREPADRDALLPDYRREPDAVPPKLHL